MGLVLFAFYSVMPIIYRDNDFKRGMKKKRKAQFLCLLNDFLRNNPVITRQSVHVLNQQHEERALSPYQHCNGLEQGAKHPTPMMRQQISHKPGCSCCKWSWSLSVCAQWAYHWLFINAVSNSSTTVGPKWTPTAGSQEWNQWGNYFKCNISQICFNSQTSLTTILRNESEPRHQNSFVSYQVSRISIQLHFLVKIWSFLVQKGPWWRWMNVTRFKNDCWWLWIS